MRNLSISLYALAAAAGTTSASTVFFENFENGHIGQFSYEDYQNGGSAFKWDGNSQVGEGNYTGGAGGCAISDSDAHGDGDYDHAIVSPAIQLGADSVLTYLTNYQNYANLDFADTDIRVVGDPKWTNLQSWNGDHGGFFQGPGEAVTLDLGAMGYDGKNVQIRFHHYDPAQDDFDWYWEVDEVKVTSTVPAPGVAALLGMGGLLIGRRRKA